MQCEKQDKAWVLNTNNPISMASWQCAMNVVKNLRPVTSSAVTSYWRLILLQATTALHWIVKQTNNELNKQNGFTKNSLQGLLTSVRWIMVLLIVHIRLPLLGKRPFFLGNFPNPLTHPHEDLGNHSINLSCWKFKIVVEWRCWRLAISWDSLCTLCSHILTISGQ